MSGRKSLVGVWRDAVRDSGLDTTAKAAAWCLSTYMNAHGLAWPSVGTLAQGISAGRKTAGLAVRRLEEAGLLEVEWSRGRVPHRYAATLPATASQRLSSEWATASLTSSNRVVDAPNRVAATQESSESCESGALSRGGRLNGAAASALLPVDECGGCHRVLPLADDTYCASCAALAEARR